MAQTLRWKTAGGLMKISLSPRVKKSDGFQTRKEKRRQTSKAQRFINNKAKHSTLEFLLAANIRPGDLVVTLTYDDEHLPASRQEADRRITAFIRRIRCRYPNFIYFINIEGRHYSDKQNQSHRYHHHMVCVCPLTADEIQRIWGQGQTEVHAFVLDADHTYDSMATYMIKESAEAPGKRAWRSSRNLAKPETDSMIVPDDYELPVPERSETCLVLENDGVYRTEYGKYQQVKFQTLDRGLKHLVDLPQRKRKKAGT